MRARVKHTIMSSSQKRYLNMTEKSPLETAPVGHQGNMINIRNTFVANVVKQCGGHYYEHGHVCNA